MTRAQTRRGAAVPCGLLLAILPAATDELHHNVDAHFFGDKDAGKDGSRLNRIRLMSHAAPLYTMNMLQMTWGTSLPSANWYQPITDSVQLTGVTIASIGLRALVAGLVILVGYVIVKLIQGAVIKGLESIRTSNMLEHSPLGEYTKQPELAKQIESIIGSILFWLLMLVVFNTAAASAGFTSLERLFSQILAYVPRLIVAVVILVMGTLLAGLIETVIKNSMRSFDPRGGRLMAKIASYVVMVLAVLIAISELGIAREYILVLFIGFVATMTLGIGLAIGLGGRSVVEDMLQRWYARFQPSATELQPDTSVKETVSGKEAKTPGHDRKKGSAS